MKLLNELLQTKQKMADLSKQHYLENVLFSYQWWLLWFLMIFLWVIWLILVDKKRIKEILLVGFISSVFAILLDDFGLSRFFWAYGYTLTYYTSRLNTVDLAIIPVAYMLLYQYFPKWKTYAIMVAVFSGFASFITEPIFIKLNIYLMTDWEHIYSFPLYFAIGIASRWLVYIINQTECKKREE